MTRCHPVAFALWIILAAINVPSWINSWASSEPMKETMFGMAEMSRGRIWSWSKKLASGDIIYWW